MKQTNEPIVQIIPPFSKRLNKRILVSKNLKKEGKKDTY
mgnify:CR=1 FL=1